MAAGAAVLLMRAALPREGEPTLPDATVPDALVASLRDGDLAFRRTEGLVGQLVLAGDREASFTHVGIVARLANGLHVIHAIPSRDDGTGGHVVVEPLDEFARPSVVAPAFLRPVVASPRAVQSAVAWAQRHATARTPFDANFDLASDSTLYCTELVWRAYLAGGLTLVAPVMARTSLTGPSHRLLTISSLERSPHLQRLGVRDHHPIDRSSTP
jgi:Permuted papain-like amidase enzyme, YaeF/YiiX, C92 family